MNIFTLNNDNQQEDLNKDDLEEEQDNSSNDEEESNNNQIDDYISEIEDLKEQLSKTQDQLLRKAAEFENAKNRHASMLEDSSKFAVNSFSKDLLSVMDNFERALAYVPDNLPNDMKNILTGIEMTKNELLSVFKKHHITPILVNPGDQFDYNIHQAISEAPDANIENGHIARVMQTGYKIHDRILRPASVVIAKNE